MIANITIQSQGQGWSQSIKSQGQVEVDGNKITFHYLTDGDPTTFYIAGKKASMTRQGTVNISMKFEEGKTTLCTFGEGQMRGEYALRTKAIDMLSGKGGYRISLTYENGMDKETITLKMVAVIKDQQK